MRELLPVLVVLAILVLAALGVAAGVVLWMSGPSHAAVGTILVYEVPRPPGGDAEAAPADLAALVTAIDRRINPGWSSNGQVRALGDGRIEVGVFGADLGKVERIQRILQRAGTLEFRVLANAKAPEHQPLVELAKAHDGPVVRTPGGDVLGWWVPIEADQHASLLSDPADLVTRPQTQPSSPSLEVLVANDVYNVTGDHLKSALPGVDERGRPCVEFLFNSRGGQLLAGLTGANPPNPMGEPRFQLGMILDGRLVSAPRIMTTIHDRGQITGSFTRQEVEDVVEVLNSGSLPAQIRQVERRSARTSDRR